MRFWPLILLSCPSNCLRIIITHRAALITANRQESPCSRDALILHGGGHRLPAMTSLRPVHVIGAGLAGSEAAWQLAEAGVPVVLHEMRPATMTAAHKTGGFAELVCSNSFRSDDWETNAVGLLHAEMRRAGSLIMAKGDAHQVPAGGALAVDREGFSEAVTAAVRAHPLVTVAIGEVPDLPPADWGLVIVATGPLTAPALAAAIAEATGEGQLAFFDAIAPIVYRDTIDMDVAWFQSRYDKAGPGGTGADYINCPLDRDQYEAFVDALLAAETAAFHDWEKDTPYFEGCLPVEEMAARGRETLRHGPMKPFGLTNPHAPDRKPYAVVQLRQDNALGTLFNIVGFQTKMRHGDQVRVLRTVPGLENAEFARLGGVHRNTFLNSPQLLDSSLQLKARPHIRFAGQITGCEGYVESAAVGLMAGRFAAAEALGRQAAPPPATSAHGALLAHITGGHVAEEGRRSFQPMNINFGLLPPVEAPEAEEGGLRLRGRARGLARKRAMARRALADFDRWLAAERARRAA
jgi:methylenetetrahydrofolate--tRNA-(uracil-5-)-methyltransferase